MPPMCFPLRESGCGELWGKDNQWERQFGFSAGRLASLAHHRIYMSLQSFLAADSAAWLLLRAPPRVKCLDLSVYQKAEWALELGRPGFKSRLSLTNSVNFSKLSISLSEFPFLAVTHAKNATCSRGN